MATDQTALAQNIQAEKDQRSTEIRARLAEIEKQERVAEIKNRLTEIDQFERGANQTVPSEILQFGGRGVFNTLAIPSRILNFAARAEAATSPGGQRIKEFTGEVPQIDVEGPERTVANLGFIPQPEERADTALERGAEIFGGALIPEIALISAGAKVLNPIVTLLKSRGVPASRFNRVLTEKLPDKAARFIPGKAREGLPVTVAGKPEVQRTGFEQVAALAAERPLLTVGIDVGSSISAGFGGDVASKFTDDPAKIALTELAFGFSFPFTSLALRVVPGNIAGTIKQKVGLVGKRQGAANQLQKDTADPRLEAFKIDFDSPVTPARQTENSRLIKREQNILDQNPALQEKFTKDMQIALQDTYKQIRNFGGDPALAGNLLKRGQEHILTLVNRRAKQAQESANAAIVKLGGRASERDIAAIYRKELDGAVTDLRAREKELWGMAELSTKGALENGNTTLNSIIARTSDRVPLDVPAWIIKGLKFKPGTKIPQWLEDAIASGSPIRLPKDLQDELQRGSVVLNDIHQMRSKLLRQIRIEANKTGTDGPDENKLRIMNELANGDERFGTKGLLGDMEATGATGMEAARDFSRELNAKISKGVVSSILSRGANLGTGIAARDTLPKLFASQTVATNIRQAIKANPKSSDTIRDFITARYVADVMKGGTYNKTTSTNKLDGLQRAGIFEIYPGLKEEMTNTQKLFGLSDDLAARAKIVNDRSGTRLSRESNQSLAGIILGGNPKQQMNNLLRAENAPQVAAAWVRRMGGNDQARQGLKQAFIETLWDNATVTREGVSEISGKALRNSLIDNMDVAKGLSITAEELARMKEMIKRIVQIQLKPDPKTSKRIVDDGLSIVMDVVASAAGSQKTTEILGIKGSGPNLIIAGRGAKAGRDIASRVSFGGRKQLLIDAIFDRPLYQSLLLRGTSPQERLIAGKNLVETWINGWLIAAEANIEARQKLKQDEQSDQGAQQ